MAKQETALDDQRLQIRNLEQASQLAKDTSEIQIQQLETQVKLLKQQISLEQEKQG